MAQRDEKQKADTAVVLCDCGGSLRSRLDFARIEKQLTQDGSVAEVALSSSFCSGDRCKATVDALANAGAKRLVVAACEPRTYEAALNGAAHKDGFNSGLCQSVNIREHCAWVTADKDAATDKAVEMITSALRRLDESEPIESIKAKVNQDVVVLGGGVAAMQAAAALAGLGHKVSLVCRAEQPGGMAAAEPEFYAHLASDRAEAAARLRDSVRALQESIKNSSKITCHTSSILDGADGQFGDFSVRIKSNGRTRQLAAGAIVLAVGVSCDFPFDLFGLGNPFTTTDLGRLHKRIETGEVSGRVAIVMDVLAEQTRGVSGHVLSAAELLAGRFAAEVKVFCHHIRVAATGLEALYRRARQAGVVFVKTDSTPNVHEESRKVVISYSDPSAGAEVTEIFDYLVMADAAPIKSALPELITRLRMGPAGAFQYDDVWLLPTDTNRMGIAVVGSARGNSEYRQALADGFAAASRIHSLLADKEIEVADDAAVVDEDKCVLCLTCLRACPHGAITVDEENKAASVHPVTCRRCGLCASLCPAGAIQLTRYTDRQTAAEMNGADTKGRVTVFACENSAIPAAAAAALGRVEYDSRVRIIRVPCAGKVDARDVLAALQAGADRVKVLGCHPDNCRYLTGSTRAKKRFERIGRMLEACGVDKSRVSFGTLASVQPEKFLQYVKE